MYKLYVKERGEGCDYTIGCGNHLFDLKALSLEEAEKEAQKILEEHTHSEREFETAYILTIQKDISSYGEVAENLYRSAREEDAKREKRVQLERLKRELGE